MLISDKYGVQQLLEKCAEFGLKEIVISPGSRNAPLTISFSQSSLFQTHLITDERSAGFYALGMSEQLNEPVALVCTSGSAILNYAPAVAEAFYRCIPLIVISADRPAEWIDQGDGQTIRQVGSLSNHILHETSIIEHPNSENEKEINRLNLKKVLSSAVSGQKGPVHINFPFSEPLYNTVKIAFPNIKKVNSNQTKKDISDKVLIDLREKWNTRTRRMILCGQHIKNPLLLNLLNELSNDRSTVILVENTSNLSNFNFINCIDRTLNSITAHQLEESFQPDILITIGGAVISKRVKSFLRDIKDLEHWKIGTEFPAMNTYCHLKKSIEIDPASFFKIFLHSKPLMNLSRYGEQWKQLNFQIQLAQESFFNKAPWSDLKVFKSIFETIPENVILHMSNSSVVRYCQLFEPVFSLKYFCNRGTSGIDGSTSTAVGAAIANSKELHYLISGDLSFLYDSNALWNINFPPNLRIIVINNGGGGIFKIIPGPSQTDDLENYFVAKHDFSIEYLCKTFRIDYRTAREEDELNSELETFMNPTAYSKAVILEVFTPGDSNHLVLNQYFEQIRIPKKSVKIFN